MHGSSMLGEVDLEELMGGYSVGQLILSGPGADCWNIKKNIGLNFVFKLVWRLYFNIFKYKSELEMTNLTAAMELVNIDKMHVLNYNKI